MNICCIDLYVPDVILWTFVCVYRKAMAIRSRDRLCFYNISDPLTLAFRNPELRFLHQSLEKSFPVCVCLFFLCFMIIALLIERQECRCLDLILTLFHFVSLLVCVRLLCSLDLTSVSFKFCFSYRL